MNGIAARRSAGVLVALLLGLAVAGCGDSGPVCHAVRGVVQSGGKPVAEANVVFYPQGDQPPDMPRPIATTDEHGNFELTTYQTGDGAPAGKYAVTVELRAPRQVGEEIVRDGPNLLPARYAKPDASPLSYEVIAGENVVPPFEIGR